MFLESMTLNVRGKHMRVLKLDLHHKENKPKWGKTKTSLNIQVQAHLVLLGDQNLVGQVLKSLVRPITKVTTKKKQKHLRKVELLEKLQPKTPKLLVVYLSFHVESDALRYFLMKLNQINCQKLSYR